MNNVARFISTIKLPRYFRRRPKAPQIITVLFQIRGYLWGYSLRCNDNVLFKFLSDQHYTQVGISKNAYHS